MSSVHFDDEHVAVRFPLSWTNFCKQEGLWRGSPVNTRLLVNCTRNWSAQQDVRFVEDLTAKCWILSEIRLKEGNPSNRIPRERCISIVRCECTSDLCIVGTAQRRCLPTAVWAKPKYRNCVSKQINNLSHKVKQDHLIFAPYTARRSALISDRISHQLRVHG